MLKALRLKQNFLTKAVLNKAARNKTAANVSPRFTILSFWVTIYSLMFYEGERFTEPYINRGVNDCMPHIHKSIEVLYVVSGVKPVTVNGVTFNLNAGELLVCFPYDLHGYGKFDGESFVAVLPLVYCESFISEVSGKIPDKNVLSGSVAKTVYEKMTELSDSKNHVLTSGITNYILGLILEEVNLNGKKSREKTLIDDILKYIDLHYSEDITLTALSKNFGYSKYYFSALFNDKFKTGLTNYLNSVRVYKSLPLLKKYNIAEVATLTGFKSPQQYHLYFKKIFGVTPHKYSASGK